MKKFISILFILISLNGISQNYANKKYYLVDSLELNILSNSDKKLLDSCLVMYHNAKHDTEKIQAITIIIEESWDDNVWPKYNLWTYNFIKKCLPKQPTPATKKFLLNSYAGTINNIGFNYKNQGDIEKALKYYHKGLKIQERIEDKKGVATSLNNIAIVLETQGELDKAIEYYNTCLKIQKEIGDKKGIARSYSNIGLVYYDQDDIINAIKYCRKSTIIQEEIGDEKGLATSLTNLAAIYSKQGNVLRALEYHQKSLALERKIGNRQGIAWALNNVGRTYLVLKNYPEAIRHIEESMQIGKEFGIPILVQNAASTFTEIYEKQNKGMKALSMHRLYIAMRDSLNNIETQKTTAKQQAKYEYEKQKVIDDSEHDKLIAVKQKEKEKQQIISYVTVFSLILVVVFLFFVFNRLKITRKQKILIEIQNQEIVDSITYAKRIQEAILPTADVIKNCLPNSFVFYQPKDIVAGDFYWVDKNKDSVLFAVADCTGHGVPGAIVSVVCHNAMDRAIREYKLHDPGKILDRTRKIVAKQLNKPQSGEFDSIEGLRDGMDIALCKIDSNSNNLQYSGAYNPLWILREGKNEIEEIKADRQAIGKVDNPFPFKTHNVNLNNGDSIYIFSDGFADQFGSSTGKKMMRKSFKKLLVSIKNQTMEDQLKSINKHFSTWKGELEQVDDVCVIGVRI